MRRLSDSKLDVKILEIPACGLKRSSPLSSDGSRKAAAARQHQSAVPLLDMNKVHMGEDMDDCFDNQNNSDRTGACYGSTPNWDAGGSEDGTIPPSRGDVDADDIGSRECGYADITNLEVRPRSGDVSGKSSKAGSKGADADPAKKPGYPSLERLSGPFPTAIAMLGALHQHKADKTDWPSALRGAKQKASPKKTKSAFEIPLALPKKTKKPTPAELSSARLPPMPGSSERRRNTGSKVRTESQLSSKNPRSKSMPGLPAIWHLAVQKIVHSHFHHHYHVVQSPEMDDVQDADDLQQADNSEKSVGKFDAICTDATTKAMDH